MAAPITPHAIPYLALVKHSKAATNPLDVPGRCALIGILHLSKLISPVIEQRNDILCSITRVVNPGVSFSTKKASISLPAVLAQIIATSANGALVIHFLLPFNSQPSLVLVAVVRILAGSEPASISVKAKQPTAAPFAI